MVVRSMTGYGKGEVCVNDKKIVVEIRTLNGKQMDISLKMPSAYREKEFDMRSAITSSLIRGKCDVYVTCSTTESTASVSINGQVLKSYLQQVQQLGSELGFDGSSAEIVNALLRFPDVLQNDKNEIVTPSSEEYAALFEALNLALCDINSFREKEGAVLIADILSRIELIESLKNSIAPFECERVERVKTKLREGIEALSVAVDANRFEQELIFYLEKYDITEEMVRLQQHLNHFRETTNGQEAPGRKLGFISQEIGREINTTGSKANHSEIQKIVVRMKDELEKIKEQSLNLL